MSAFGFHPVPKPAHKRNKPTAKQRGAISNEVYNAAMERSKGRCERCGSIKGLQCAHLIRRWQIDGKTTVKDVAMLCLECHFWADNTKGGREWLSDYRNGLLSHEE